MMNVANEALQYLDMSTEKFKFWINSSKDIIYFREAYKRTELKKVERQSMKQVVPLWEKLTLTLEEAAAYSGIGIHKLRQLTDAKNCPFILWNGNKRLIKRKRFDEYIDNTYSI